MKFVKKPVVVDAVQFLATKKSFDEITNFIGKLFPTHSGIELSKFVIHCKEKPSLATRLAMGYLNPS